MRKINKNKIKNRGKTKGKMGKVRHFQNQFTNDEENLRLKEEEISRIEKADLKFSKLLETSRKTKTIPQY